MIFTDENGKKYELDHYYGGTNELVIKPVPDSPTRWRAKKDEEYWHVEFSGKQGGLAVYVDTAGRYTFEDGLYESGNYFKTEAQATAAAEALRAVLSDIQDTSKEQFLHTIKPDTERAILKARRIVQGRDE